MNAKRVLLNWFEAGDLQQVLAGLRAGNEHWADKGVAESVTFQSSRLQSLKENKSRNLISQADYQLESDRIRQAILEIIQALPDEWGIGSLEKVKMPSIHVASSQRLKWMITTGALLIVIATSILYCNRTCWGEKTVENAQMPLRSAEQAKPSVINDETNNSPKKQVEGKTSSSSNRSTSERQISGYVRDPIGNPLEGVAVSTLGIEAKTDINGHFKLVLVQIPPNREVRLHFSKTGFHSGDEIYFEVPKNNIQKIL